MYKYILNVFIHLKNPYLVKPLMYPDWGWAK